MRIVLNSECFICKVSLLVSASYEKSARTWVLRKHETFCLLSVQNLQPLSFKHAAQQSPGGHTPSQQHRDVIPEIGPGDVPMSRRDLP